MTSGGTSLTHLRNRQRGLVTRKLVVWGEEGKRAKRGRVLWVGTLKGMRLGSVRHSLWAQTYVGL